MKMDSYTVLGVMSGTSIDGIDLCHVSFEVDKGWRFKIINAETIPYAENWKLKLKSAINLQPALLKELDISYTEYIAACVNDFILKHNIRILDAICSHGHTVYHQPENAFTLQIGNRPKLAELTGFRVVCDFRVQDVKLGGQGAPLVPIGDKLLFSEFAACLNLGGFSNVSYDLNGKRIAYDICPVNIVLNELSAKAAKPFDENGDLARTGKINQALLSELNELDFYKTDIPKSLGLEWVQKYVFPILDNYEIPINDKLATFVEHIVQQIGEQLNPLGKINVLITGGGALNVFLMERMKVYLKGKAVLPEKQILDFKEALIFGLLGVLRIRNEVNCLKSVTGAAVDHSSGEIYMP